MTKQQQRLTEKTRAELVDEAQRRHVYVKKWLHVAPSVATRDDLIRAIRADERRRRARKAARERRRLVGAAVGGVAAGVGATAFILAKKVTHQSSPPLLPPPPPLPPYPSRFSTPSIPPDPEHYSPRQRDDDPLLHNRFTELLAQQAERRAERRRHMQGK